MTARVVFQPVGAEHPLPLHELGRDDSGAWGLIEDGAWRAAPIGDALELLYLSQRAYEHAVRGLTAGEIAEAVALRRATFSSAIPSIAIGVVEMRVRDCLATLGTTDEDSTLRHDLLAATASFTLVAALADSKPLRLFDALQAGDAEIIAELESPSLRAAGGFDASAEAGERASRRRFAAEIGDLATARGRPAEQARLLPYHDVVRAYLLTPSSAALEAAAHSFHEPTMHFADGLIISVPERELESVCADGHSATVVFPTRHQFLGAGAGMTPAQLNVEVNDRLRDPGFAALLCALRLQQATLRAAVQLLCGQDREIAPVVNAQVEEEAKGLGTWLRPSPVTGHDVRAVSEDSEFLVALCQRRGKLHEAGPLTPFARALSQIAGRERG